MDDYANRRALMDNVEAACDLLCAWHEKGMELPGYMKRRGKPYLYELFTHKSRDDYMSIAENWPEIFAPYEDKVRAVIGPHGWAIVKIMQHRLAIRRKREEKVKIRNKKAKLARNERAWHTRLQND